MVFVATLMASEPATPTLLAPAPLLASADESLFAADTGRADRQSRRRYIGFVGDDGCRRCRADVERNGSADANVGVIAAVDLAVGLGAGVGLVDAAHLERAGAAGDALALPTRAVVVATPMFTPTAGPRRRRFAFRPFGAVCLFVPSLSPAELLAAGRRRRLRGRRLAGRRRLVLLPGDLVVTVSPLPEPLPGPVRCRRPGLVATGNAGRGGRTALRRRFGIHLDAVCRVDVTLDVRRHRIDGAGEAERNADRNAAAGRLAGGVVVALPCGRRCC